MSSIDPGLLKILCCPETHQPVSEVDAAALAEVNNRIAAGTMMNRAGKPVTDKLDGGLLRQDRKVLYPIRKGIPIMLIEDAISLL